MATSWDLRRPQFLSYRYLSYYKATLSMTLFLFIIILTLSTASKNYIYILFRFLDCTFFYATSVYVYIVCGCVWARGLGLTSGVLPQEPSIIASDQDVPLSWNWSSMRLADPVYCVYDTLYETIVVGSHPPPAPSLNPSQIDFHPPTALTSRFLPHSLWYLCKPCMRSSQLTDYGSC